MRISTTTRTLAALATVLAVAGGVSACGSDDEPEAGGTVTHGPSGTASPGDGSTSDASTPGVPGSTVTPDDPDGTSSPSSPASPSGPAECTAADVSLAYDEDGGAAGTTYGFLVVTNDSDAPCVTEGFGGVSYVAGDAGDQVGAAADRDTSDQAPQPAAVVLQPGDAASSRVAETSAGPYPKARCEPTAVDGFRVYLPDETASLYVEHPTTGCANPDVHLLRNQAFTAA